MPLRTGRRSPIQLESHPTVAVVFIKALSSPAKDSGLLREEDHLPLCGHISQEFEKGHRTARIALNGYVVQYEGHRLPCIQMLHKGKSKKEVSLLGRSLGQVLSLTPRPLLLPHSGQFTATLRESSG